MRWLAHIVLPAAVLAAPAGGEVAGGDPVRAYGMTLTRYVTVDRPDGSFRRIYFDRGAPSPVSDGGPTEGTRLVMESFRSGSGIPSTVFVKEWRDGGWLYGGFSPDRPGFTLRPGGACAACHDGSDAPHKTFTAPSLARVLAGGAAERVACDRPGRSPCSNAVYDSAAP